MSDYGYVPSAPDYFPTEPETKAFLGGVLGIEVNDELQPISDQGIVDLTFVDVNAAQSAQAAAQSASDAEDAKDLAVSAKDTAVEAKDDAVQAKDDAETAQGIAEGARDASLGYMLDSSKWATGQISGQDVPSTDPTYQNNSKYYAQQAASSATAADGSAEDAEAYAVGKRDGVDVTSGDPAYQNNAKYYKEQAANSASAAAASAATLVLDSTLTQATQAAQAKAAGDAISDVNNAFTNTNAYIVDKNIVPMLFDMALGTISESGVPNPNNSQAIYTPGFVTFDGNIHISKSNASTLTIHKYESDGTWVRMYYFGDTKTEIDFDVDTTKKYMIKYSHSPVDTIPSNKIVDYSLEFKIYQLSNKLINTFNLYSLNEKSLATGEISYNPDSFINGSLTNGALSTNILYRIASTTILTAVADITLVARTGFRFSAHLFTSGSYTGNSGWITKEYTIPKGQQYKLLIARQTENTSEVADIAVFASNIYAKSYAMEHTVFSYSMQNPLGGYIRHGTGEFRTSAGTQCFKFTNNGITHLKVFTSSDTDTIDAVAFFSGDTISEETYISASSVAWAGNYPSGLWYDVDVPAEAKCIAVSVIRYREPYAKPQIIFNLKESMFVLDNVYGEEISEIKQDLKENMVTALTAGLRYVYHFGMEYVSTRTPTPPVIPSQSIYDIQNAKNLGFKCIEANVHKTATDHAYVVTHGVAGALGHDFDDLNGNDAGAQNIKISEHTLTDLRTNYRYRSSDPNYRVSITTLDEFLAECARLDMKVMLMYRDQESMQLALDVLGKNRVWMYNAPRDEYSGPITNYRNYTTKAEIVADCESFGLPYVYSMGNPEAFTDDELKDIAQTLHSMGYQLMTAYKTDAIMDKLASFGWDYFILGSNSYREPVVINGKQINFNLDGTVTWTDAVIS